MLRAAWHFRRFLRPYRLPLITGAVLVAIMTVADLAQPWPLKVIVDGAINRKPQHNWLARLIAGGATGPQAVLIHALIALAFFVVLSALMDFFSEKMMSGSGERVMRDIRNALFGHMQRLSLSYHNRQRVGDMTLRLAGDIDRLQTMLVAIFDTLIPNSLMLLGLAIAILAINPGFGLLSLTIAPLLFVVTFRYTIRIKQALRRARQADAGVAAHASETLTAIHAVQAFNREAHEDKRFDRRSDEAMEAGLAAVRLKAAFTPMVDVVSLIGLLIVTYFGARRVMSGEMTLGVLLVFLAYLKSLYSPMRQLSRLAYLVSRGTVSADRVLEVLNTDARMPEPRTPNKLSRVEGAVELRNVTFSYAPHLEPALRDISISVGPGERLGIVGPSGAGKSTFVSLIPRLYDPQEGTLTIDGLDIRTVSLASLRSQVGLVLQEPILFYGSIFDNILYGDPEAPAERVLEAAAAANVTEFLDDLPEGIFTEIGERGVMLSGGQRQRITVARAILRDAPILILDEPTTGLDRKSERLVLDGLGRLAEGKTTFVISHHAAPLIGVDRIIHIEDGVLVEETAPANGHALNGKEGVGGPSGYADREIRMTTTPGPAELEQTIRVALEDDTAHRGMWSVLPGGPDEVPALLSALECDLNDWGFAYGVAWAVAKARYPFESDRRVAERALQAARAVFGEYCAGEDWSERLAERRRDGRTNGGHGETEIRPRSFVPLGPNGGTGDAR